MEYPINEQDFEVIRNEGCVYVDKTAYVYEMTHTGRFYFLSRPRRFGKSLLVSTLEAYFLGKKDLFKGLVMEKLEKDWTEYQVLHLDFSGGSYAIDGRLERILNTTLCDWEEIYGNKPQEDVFETRFKGIIRRAYEKEGRQVVILVDEYDKPLLDVIDKPELHEKNRVILGGLYEVLKSQSKYIRFAFLTGVTKFSKVTIFSGMNNLEDISLDKNYACICGITEDELLGNFDESIRKLAAENEMTFDAACRKLEDMYDGYHFASKSPGVYNPLSLLYTFKKREFGTYWYQSGTPSFLIKLLSDDNFNLMKLNEKIKGERLMSVDNLAPGEVVPVLYQSGYLTVKEWDEDKNEFTLGFPNGEVRESFQNCLMESYLGITGDDVDDFVKNFVGKVLRGEPEAFLSGLKARLDKTPYKIIGKREIYYQNALFFWFGLVAGATVIPEDVTTVGRIDLTVITDKYIYVMELKLGGSAKKALAQINERQYHLKYMSEGKKIFKIGVNCSSKEKNRNIDTWLIEEVPG